MRSSLPLLAALLILPAAVRAESGIVTLEGDRVDGPIEAIDSTGAVTLGSPASRRFEYEALRSIHPDHDQPRPDPVPGRVYLMGGSRLAFTGIEISDEQVAIDTASLGKLEILIDAVRGIRFHTSISGSRFERALLKPPRERDLDTLFITGSGELQEADVFIEEMTPGKIVFDRGGKLQEIPLARVHGVVLASPLSPSDNRIACRVLMADRSEVVGNMSALAQNQLSARLSDGLDVKIPWPQVRRINIQSGRIEYLSDLETREERQQIILAPRRQWNRDLSIDGNELRIGKLTYEKGLGVAAGTWLRFDNPEEFDLFTATIGIDAETKGRGDCVFVFKADGRELLRQRVLGTDPPRPVKIDLPGVKEIVLSIEPGQDLDLADHANWAEACFIRRL